MSNTKTSVGHRVDAIKLSPCDPKSLKGLKLGELSQVEHKLTHVIIPT